MLDLPFETVAVSAVGCQSFRRTHRASCCWDHCYPQSICEIMGFVQQELTALVRSAYYKKKRKPMPKPKKYSSVLTLILNPQCQEKSRRGSRM